MLTDNGKQFTDRFGKGGEVLFDRICRDNGITHTGSPSRGRRATTGRSSGSTPGNSIRNRREICVGDHHCSSQAQTWAASCGQASLGVLGRRAYSWAC